MASRDKKQPEKRDDSGKSEILHRMKTHPVLFFGTVVVLVIVIVAFVFVPAIVPEARGSGDLIFGYYNKVPIKYVPNNYFYQVQQSIAQSQQPSQDDPNFMSSFYQIWRQAFEETAIRMGILDEMKQVGYVVPEEVMNREMAELPHFQENGRFSSAKYRAMDNSSRMTLWRQVQESKTVGTYLSDLAGLKTASAEASFISSMASPKRSFDLVTFPFSDFPDSELRAYVDANRDLFRVIRLSRITISSSEREARQILELVKNGTTTFEEAAINNSQDWAAERGGDVGIVMAYDLTYEISDAEARESVLRLTRGEISDVIKVPSGWAFYRADEVVHPADLDDPTQSGRIRNYLLNFQRGYAEDWLISEAEKFSAQAREIGFDEAIAARNLTKKSLSPIPVNYGNTALFGSVRSAGVQELEYAGDNQFFWRAAFSTPLNTPSEPVVVGDNVIVLFPLEEILAEEDEIGFIEMYYPYWTSASTENNYRSYFLNNKKMDDRFQETFFRIWGGY